MAQRRLAAVQPTETVAAAASTLDPFIGLLNRPNPDTGHLWQIYDRLGELNYGVGFKAHAAERLSYYVGVRETEDQDPDPELADPKTEGVLGTLQGPVGGVSQIVAEIVAHLEVVGEAILTGQTEDRPGFGEERVWDVWSDDEYNSANIGPQPLVPDQATWEGDDRVAIRVWRPHLRNRAIADSPLRHNVDVAEQLILLSDVVTSIARSRLVAPIVGLPQEVEIPGAPKPNNLPQALRHLPPVIAALTQASTTAVKDTNAASRVVPTFLQAPGDRLEQIVVIDVLRNLPEQIMDLLEKAQRRFATGMDLPAEVVTGLADVNHWTAWQVDESAYRQHVDPGVRLVLDSLTRGWLWPTLLLTGMAPDQVKQHVIWRDFSDLVAKQDTIEDALAMYNAEPPIVSAEYVRRVSGANESDAPEIETTTEVRDLKIEADAIGTYIRGGFLPDSAIEAVMTGDLTKLVHTGLLPVTVKDKPQVEGEGVTEDIEPAPRTPEPPPAPDRPAGPNNVQPGPPVAAANAVPLDEFARIDSQLFVRIEALAQSALERAVERAGAKIRRQVERQQASNRAPAHQALAAAIDGQPNLEVGVILGPERVRQLALSDEELIPENSFSGLERDAAKTLLDGSRLVDQELENLGAAPANEEERRNWIATAVIALAAALRALAFRRLYTPKPGQPDADEGGEIADGIVPATDIWATLTLAAGGIPGPDLRLRGLGLSDVVMESLADAGYQTMMYRWDYQGFLPRETFEPHLRLNGVTYTSPDDEKLAVGHGGEWLGRSFYSPGDHRGCRCIEVPIVEVGDAVR